LREFRTKIGKQRENSLALLNTIREDGIVLPREASNVKSNYYQFGIRLPGEPLRDELASFLLNRGIDAARYLDDVVEGARREYGYPGGCPVSEEISRTLLVLPNHYTLSASSIRHIADSVNSWTRTESGS
jgi:dTDP-4-amino-4,6-dideoxygalactose transaminase